MLDTVTSVPSFGTFNQISDEILQNIQSKSVSLINNKDNSKAIPLTHEKPSVVIYTDGSWKNAVHAGGWSALLTYNDEWKLIGNGAVETTINRMELSAVIQALKCLKEPCKVQVVSDSQLTVNIINQFIYGWRKKNFISAKGTPVMNLDLIKELDSLMKVHTVKAQWVKSHTGFKDPLSKANDLCDYWAQEMADRAGNVNIKKGVTDGCQKSINGRKRSTHKFH